MEAMTREFAENIIEYILSTSDNESEQFVKDRVRKFKAENRTDAEVYDFICTIGDMKVERITIGGQKACIGYISGFVQVLCDLRPYYARPSDGVSTPSPVGGWPSFRDKPLTLQAASA